MQIRETEALRLENEFNLAVDDIIAIHSAYDASGLSLKEVQQDLTNIKDDVTNNLFTATTASTPGGPLDGSVYETTRLERIEEKKRLALKMFTVDLRLVKPFPADIASTKTSDVCFRIVGLDDTNFASTVALAQSVKDKFPEGYVFFNYTLPEDVWNATQTHLQDHFNVTSVSSPIVIKGCSDLPDDLTYVGDYTAFSAMVDSILNGSPSAFSIGLFTMAPLVLAAFLVL